MDRMSKFKVIKSALAATAFLLAVAVTFTSPAAAQDAAGKTYAPWHMIARLSSAISVTGSSAPTALPSGGLSAWLCNTGSNDAYVAFGNANTVTASLTGSDYLKAGTCADYDLYPIGQPSTPYTYVAIIGTGSTTVTVETGIGQAPNTLGSGGGSVTGTVTANQGSAGTTAWPTTQLGVGNLATGQVSVPSTAGGTVIVAARTGAPGTGRKTVCVTNVTGTAPVYLGASGLTTSTGDYLAGTAGAGKCWDTQAAVYGIVSSTSQTVSFTETY